MFYKPIYVKKKHYIHKKLEKKLKIIIKTKNNKYTNENDLKNFVSKLI
jgi:hypothetical protein